MSRSFEALDSAGRRLSTSNPCPSMASSTFMPPKLNSATSSLKRPCRGIDQLHTLAEESARPLDFEDHQFAELSGKGAIGELSLGTSETLHVLQR